jgi:O6-methylguanine-DNA--protein-cysteine methyltransferase
MNTPLLFDIKNLSTEADSLKRLIDMFVMLGETLVTHDIDKNLKISDVDENFKYKNVRLTFADSQTVTFSIKQTGDIWQVKLNNKRIALRNQDAHKPEAVVQEIAQKIKAGRTAYQQALAKKVNATEVVQSVKQAGLKNTQKMRVASLEEQLKAIEALIVERTAYKTQLEAELAA